MHDLDITYQDPARLKPRARNARTHSPAQVRQIADSIAAFGFANPVLVDGAGEIIAGHGRVAAALLLGLERVPTITLGDLSPAQIRAYVIADNKLAENAGWDSELLGLELREMSVDLDFDLSLTGFEAPEIDLLIGGFDESERAEEPIPLPAPGPAVTRPGDIWEMGLHRLICGDALESDVYDRLLGDTRAQMVFTDPPYNVPIDGHVSGLGKVAHREFAMASGEMTSDGFTTFLNRCFTNLVEHSLDGSIHFVCMDWRHMGEVLAAGLEPYAELKNVCVWAKTNGGMGSLYRSQHELVFVFKAGTASHINNVELGKHGRNRSNLWTYAGANGFGADRDDALAMHPTVKPVDLVEDAILDCSKRGGVVLDAFAGSGTTLVAAHRAGRRGYGIEIDPAYCDVTVARMAASCGLIAVLAETNQTFEEVAIRRGAEMPGAPGTSGIESHPLTTREDATPHHP